jgi:hypothetical protein
MKIQNAELAQGEIEIVLFYTQRYKHARHLVMPDLSFVYQVEIAANKIWWDLGLYDKYNQDYFGATFVQREEDDTYFEELFYDQFNTDNDMRREDLKR